MRPGFLLIGIQVSGNGQRHIVDYARAANAAQLDGRGVHGDGLDGRAHGHVHIAGAVQGLAPGGRRAAAHNGLDLARAVIQHHGGGLGLHDLIIGAVGIARAVNAVLGIAQGGVIIVVVQHVLHRFLDLGIQAEVYVIAAGAQLVFHQVAVIAGVVQLVDLEQRLHHIADGVLHVVHVVVQLAFARALQHVRGIGRQRRDVLLVGDELVFVHHAQGVIGAVVGDGRVIGGLALPGVEIAPGIIVVGIGAHAGQHGALAQRQIAQLFAKVALGRRVHAVVVFAQVDGVQVAFQDLLLGVLVFQLHGQVGFLDLALVALLAAQDGVLDQLLGDGAAALLGAGDEVLDQRAGNALDILRLKVK